MMRSILRGSRRARKKAMRSRVWLDGLEVTHDCQRADSRRGTVVLLKRTNGQAYKRWDGQRHVVAREVRHGRVVIARMDDVVVPIALGAAPPVEPRVADALNASATGPRVTLTVQWPGA